MAILFLSTVKNPIIGNHQGNESCIGLYRPGNFAPINADANGAANILRKVAATLGLCLEGVSSGASTTPVRVHYWAACESPSL